MQYECVLCAVQSRYKRGNTTAVDSQLFSTSLVKMIKQCALVFGRLHQQLLPVTCILRIERKSDIQFSYLLFMEMKDLEEEEILLQRLSEFKDSAEGMGKFEA